jgi:hypothetical protein
MRLNHRDGSEMLVCVRGKTAYLFKIDQDGLGIAVTYSLENAGEEALCGIFSDDGD